MVIKKSNEKIESQIVTIKSAQRDYGLFPSSFDYIFEFDKPMYGIHSIELLSAELPNSDYIIHENNNKIDFQIEGNSTIYTLEVPIGDYDATSLATEMQNQLNTIIDTWTVVADEVNTLKYTFTNTINNFRFLTSTGPSIESSIGPVIGYKLIGDNGTDTEYSSSQIPPFTFSLSGDTGIILDLGDTSTNFYHTLDNQDPQYFARLPLKVDPGSWSFWTRETEYEIKYEFNTRIHPILERLHVRFYKENYNKTVFYNFRGEDNVLVFKIRGFFNKMYATQNAEEFDQPSYEMSLLKGVNEQSNLLLDIKESLKNQNSSTLVDTLGNTITSLKDTLTGKKDEPLIKLADDLFEEVSEPEIYVSEDSVSETSSSEDEPEIPEPEEELNVEEDHEEDKQSEIDEFNIEINTTPMTVEDEKDDKVWKNIPLKFAILLGAAGIVLIIMLRMLNKNKK